MSYSFQTFSVGQVLQASHMNQVEVNIRDHVHGSSSVLAMSNITENLQISGDITPTTISADQNDYNPTGLSTASVIRITTDSTDRNITGLQGGADGRIMIIHHAAGSGKLVLKKEDGGSAVANRFSFAADVSLELDDSYAIQYDSSSSRWRPLVSRIDAASDSRSGIIKIAAQSDLESATSLLLTVTPGRQHFHPSACKGWVKADFAAAAAASYNVTSITDVSAGHITVVWATDFSSTHYSCVATTQGDPAGTAASTFVAQVGQTGTAAGQIDVFSIRMSDFAGTDANYLHVQAFGDQ